MLVATGVGVLLGTAEGRAKVIVCSGTEGYDTVDLTSEGVECLFVSTPHAEVEGTGAELGINAILLLEVMGS